MNVATLNIFHIFHLSHFGVCAVVSQVFNLHPPIPIWVEYFLGMFIAHFYICSFVKCQFNSCVSRFFFLMTCKCWSVTVPDLSPLFYVLQIFTCLSLLSLKFSISQFQWNLIYLFFHLMINIFVSYLRSYLDTSTLIIMKIPFCFISFIVLSFLFRSTICLQFNFGYNGKQGSWFVPHCFAMPSFS